MGGHGIRQTAVVGNAVDTVYDFCRNLLIEFGVLFKLCQQGAANGFKLRMAFRIIVFNSFYVGDK